MVPEQKRKHQDFEWLGKNMHKLQLKHVGKYIAVVNKHVSFGNTLIEAYNKSKKLYPDNEPLLDVVPSKDTLLL
jgi:hypothetical protein